MIFIATHDGVSIRCTASLNKLAEVTVMRAGSIATSAANADDVWDAVCEAIVLLNKMIRSGLTFDDLRTFRNSPGVFGAVIEGLDIALEPLRSSLRSCQMEVAG